MKPTLWVLVGLLIAHAVLVGFISCVNSPSVDETGHLPAGISHWTLGEFDLYRVNPPLVRMVGALPVVLAFPEADWSKYTSSPYARTEFTIGHEFGRANGARTFWYFTLARWSCISFSLIGGYFCFRWASDLHGSTSGIVAACLWCFSPNILGNAAMITPDVGAAALGARACVARFAASRNVHAEPGHVPLAGARGHDGDRAGGRADERRERAAAAAGGAVRARDHRARDTFFTEADAGRALAHPQPRGAAALAQPAAHCAADLQGLARRACLDVSTAPAAAPRQEHEYAQEEGE